MNLPRGHTGTRNKWTRFDQWERAVDVGDATLRIELDRNSGFNSLASLILTATRKLAIGIRFVYANILIIVNIISLDRKERLLPVSKVCQRPSTLNLWCRH